MAPKHIKLVERKGNQLDLWTAVRKITIFDAAGDLTEQLVVDARKG